MNWKEKLNNAGHRISQAREQIMDLLLSTHTPLSPVQIYEALKEQGSQMSLVSVYRNLELLVAYELVCLVFTPDGSTGYVAGETGHHHHILCRECHKSAAFEGCEGFEELISKIEKQTHFKVLDHLLQFYGLCQDCQVKYA